jgi:AraC-like DNA-binding protein
MIRAQLETLNPQPHASFLATRFLLEQFTVPYHFHPEYELTFIGTGKGKRFVGKSMENFEPGELVLLGADLPHCWKSDDPVSGQMKAESLVIHFERDFLGSEFLSKPELSGISNLLKRSATGIRFSDDTAKNVGVQMADLIDEKNNFKRMMLFLNILEELAGSKTNIFLDQAGTTAQQPDHDKRRINLVMGYIVENFQNEILLNKVSALANMSPNAFCKYFKKVTNQTFMETVTDYRINYAMQQLLSTDKTISEISMESGFGDISYFFKVFKRRMKISPLSYRKSFLIGYQG